LAEVESLSLSLLGKAVSKNKRQHLHTSYTDEKFKRNVPVQK